MKLKLHSMVEFILLQKKMSAFVPEAHTYRLKAIVKYASFLKQPLTLGMFVPCDSKQEPIERPEQYGFWLQDEDKAKYENSIVCELYRIRSKLVIFPGFELMPFTQERMKRKGKTVRIVKNGNTVIGLYFTHGEHQTVEDLVPHNLSYNEKVN